MEGYYKISRHYKWALTQIFDLYGFRLAIIIEGKRMARGHFNNFFIIIIRRFGGCTGLFLLHGRCCPSPFIGPKLAMCVCLEWQRKERPHQCNKIWWVWGGEGREGGRGLREEGRVHFKFSDLLYRSDFFPGLGWMLTSDLWHELKPKWPPR